MIYLFCGSDVDKVRTKAFTWIASAKEKEPQVIYTRLTATQLSEETLMEVEESGSLFVKRLLVLIDEPYTKTKNAGVVSSAPTSAVALRDGTGGGEGISSQLFDSHIDALAASNNAIIILSPNLTASRVEKISAKAVKKYVFNKTTVSNSRGFNNALVNALSMRDSSTLWLEIIRARAKGDAPEMVHGLLHWKARDIMQKGSRVWTFSDARALSLELIVLLGDVRRTGFDLTYALERFALSIK